MDKQSKHRLPQQCLFINANGEIMSIEYGKSEFSRSELSRKIGKQIGKSSTTTTRDTVLQPLR